MGDRGQDGGMIRERNKYIQVNYLWQKLRPVTGALFSCLRVFSIFFLNVLVLFHSVSLISSRIHWSRTMSLV